MFASPTAKLRIKSGWALAIAATAAAMPPPPPGGSVISPAASTPETRSWSLAIAATVFDQTSSVTRRNGFLAGKASRLHRTAGITCWLAVVPA